VCVKPGIYQRLVPDCAVEPEKAGHGEILCVALRCVAAGSLTRGVAPRAA
jgi:hypothetical protein